MRQRRLRAPLTAKQFHRCKREQSIFDGILPSQKKDATAEPESKTERYGSSTAQAGEELDEESADVVSETTKQALQAFDQEALFDAMAQLNAFIRTLDALNTSVPRHVQSRIPHQLQSNADGQDKHPPYILSEARKPLAQLPGKVNAATRRAKHARLHIQDLQTEEYKTPSDGLVAWKEEIAGLSKPEKKDLLEQLLRDEMADVYRNNENARRNRDRMRGLLEGKKAKRKVLIVEKVKLEAFSGRSRRYANEITVKGLEKGAKKDSGKDAFKIKAESNEGGMSLDALQKRLAGEMP
jgi:hypothetical protein